MTSGFKRSSEVQVAWVLGKVKTQTALTSQRFKSESKRFTSDLTPQLWIEKDEFFPLGYMIPSAQLGDALLEIRLSDYHMYQKMLYPHQIKIVNLQTSDVLLVELVEFCSKLDGFCYSESILGCNT